MLHVIFVLAPSDEIYCVHLCMQYAVRSTPVHAVTSDAPSRGRPWLPAFYATEGYPRA
jgi:hypothetical protein